jgi:uncharacterized protein DUF6551
MTAKTSPKQFPAEVLEHTIFERNVPFEKMFVAFRDQPDGYARPLNERRVAKIDAEFNPKALGIILLSLQDDGTYAVIDGQHRSEVAKRHGYTGMDAYVYIDLTVEEEARLYRQFGDYFRQSARDRWYAAIVERQPEALAIERILAEFGLHVSNDAGRPGGVAAVESIMKISRQHGPVLLRETLRTLNDAFGHDPVAYIGAALVGMAMFLDRFNANPKYKRAQLVDRLNRIGARKWEQQALHVQALERGDKGVAFGKALLIIHDNGRKPEFRLSEWQERKLTPSSLAAARERIKKATKRSVEARKNGAVERSKEVRCRTCHAAPGKLCIGVDYPHMTRLRDAAQKRREAKVS